MSKNNTFLSSTPIKANQDVMKLTGRQFKVGWLDGCAG